ARATPAMRTLSLHDALPICADEAGGAELAVTEADALHGGRGRGLRREGRRHGTEPFVGVAFAGGRGCGDGGAPGAPASSATRPVDRKSTRLNSSHVSISYAV